MNDNNSMHNLHGASPPLGWALILMLMFCTGPVLYAQSTSPTVIAGGGAFLENGTGSLSITIGQPTATTYSTSANAMTPGFQQPELLLQTGTVSQPVCIGSSLSVPYTASGYFGSLNTFIAELSDAAGSFASPTVIGTAAGSVSGTIDAGIPSGTPPGTGYRIRVFSTMPGFVGHDNGFDIALNTPPTPTIAVNPSPAVDPGGELNTIYLGYGPQSVTLTATGGVSYFWSPSAYLSGTGIANPVFTPTVEGSYTYTVTTTDVNGCSANASVTIYVIDVYSGNNNNLVTICHHGKTKHVNPNAVAALIANAGATIGPCTPKIAVRPANETTVANAIVLRQNYPNPFNPVTTISYAVPEDCPVRLLVFDVYGRLVSTLVDAFVAAGAHSVVFDAAQLPSGIYTYVLESGSTVLKRKMVFMK